MLSAFGASGLGFRFELTHQGFGCFNGLTFSSGLASGPARLFFKPHQLNLKRNNSIDSKKQYVRRNIELK